MRKLRAAATAALVVGTLMAAAPPATAASFEEPAYGGGLITYNDGTDTFCTSMPESSSFDYLKVTVKPEVAGRGPTHSFTVHPGGRKCRSLATAYEDSAYRYSGIAGYDQACRCAKRFFGEFYS